MSKEGVTMFIVENTKTEVIGVRDINVVVKMTRLNWERNSDQQVCC